MSMSMSASGKPVTPRSISSRIERLLGPGAAALLGAASAFFCFAMPAAIVSAAIGALHLPPAVAESRLALAVCIGLIVATLTWFGFAALDRPARSRAVAFGALEGEADLAPILRRADAHPDAPPRRPIFAGSDLGTPLDLIDPLPADWTEQPRSPEPWTPPVQTPSIQTEPDFETIDLLEAAPLQQSALAPVATPTIAVATPLPVVARYDPPAVMQAGSAQATPSLAALMARLETGLARKSLVLAGAEANVTALKREIRPIGGSLRAAVDELQDRTAARG